MMESDYSRTHTNKHRLLLSQNNIAAMLAHHFLVPSTTFCDNSIPVRDLVMPLKDDSYGRAQAEEILAEKLEMYFPVTKTIDAYELSHKSVQQIYKLLQAAC